MSKLDIFAAEQFETDFDNIKSPPRRRRLTKELTKLIAELESGKLPAASRKEAELAGCPGIDSPICTNLMAWFSRWAMDGLPSPDPRQTLRFY